MRTALGLILVLAGGGLMLYGIGAALLELRGLYEGATGNAMGMAPTAEKDVSRAMIRAAIIGGCGAPFFVAGSVMLRLTVFQRLMGGRRQGVSRKGRI